uniref:Apolipoprotein L3 n=1 Tax=Laticauda laticaudata TaxID=8630 RepID=A0A8C5SRI3_LATLA
CSLECSENDALQDSFFILLAYDQGNGGKGSCCPSPVGDFISLSKIPLLSVSIHFLSAACQISAMTHFRKERKMPWEETAREDFVKGFPMQKKEIEMYFSCLQEVANHIDRIHKGCTTASLVSCSTSATSGILTILGLTLAPITAGGSLILTATGIGLGAGATAIGLSAALYENIINSKERKRAEGLMNACEKSLRKSVQPLRICSTIELTPNNRMMGKNAWKTVQTHLKTLVNGPTLAMTKGARMLNAVSAGLFLLVDTYGLVQDAKHLMKGGKAELASEIRKKATLFEEELQNLSKLYNELKDLE